MIQLTEEQQTIVACDLKPGQTLKIIAFAGTGKTATLVAYARARPRMRFLYLAFNKSVQLEAAAKFPSNVVSRTSHALAFRTHGHPHKNRLVSGFRANTVMQALGLGRYEDARFVIDTLHNYLVSADQGGQAAHPVSGPGLLRAAQKRHAGLCRSGQPTGPAHVRQNR
jgi:F-box protein 18 (helicase)